MGKPPLLNTCVNRAGGLQRAVLLLLLCIACVSPLQAVEVPTLYTAEVPLDSEAGDPRAEAYAAALRVVLLRVSGSELANDPELLESLFPNPGSYVTQFRSGPRDTLFVSFDGQAIEQVLRNSGQTVWGAERPLTLVWLAVDWGQGEREIVAADDPDRTEQESRSIDRNRLLRERVLDIARQRGLPVVFPLLDTIDLQGVTFSDIWGGFDDAVIAASERYDVNSILIGRVRPSSGQQNRWTYYFSGDQRSMSGPPEAVISQVADILAGEFAVGGDAPIERVALNIAGVVSVEAFGSVQQILGSISLIEDFAITEVAGDRISYRVDVRGGAARLGRALQFKGLTEQAGDGLVPDNALEFFYGT